MVRAPQYVLALLQSLVDSWYLVAFGVLKARQSGNMKLPLLLRLRCSLFWTFFDRCLVVSRP